MEENEYYYTDPDGFTHEVSFTDPEGYPSEPYYSCGEDTIYVSEDDISDFNWAEAGD